MSDNSEESSHEVDATDFEKLRTLLRELKQKQPSNVFERSDFSFQELNEKSEIVKQTKQQQGIVIIHQAFTDEALASARAAAKAAWIRDVQPQIDVADRPPADADLFAITNNEKLWPTTIIGNKTFGYLFAGPEAKADQHKHTLSSGKQIVFAMCAAFQANLALLCHASSTLILDLIFKVSGHENDSVISQDSCKLHRGVLTPAHVDIYEKKEQVIHRMQAMAFGAGEGNVRLCFLRFSNRPEVRALITKMIRKDIFGSTGYQPLPSKTGADEFIFSCFRDADCVQYGGPRDLVMWEPGVIHLEALLGADGRVVIRNDKSTTTERYIVGTHVPTQLTQRDLLEIGCIADQGFIFHPYNNANAGNAADLNSVHKKKTQWKAARFVMQDEADRFAALGALDYDATAASWNTARRRCYMGQPVHQRKHARNDDDDNDDDDGDSGEDNVPISNKKREK